MDSCQITQWCARFIREQVKPGDLCIDATMGNGNDTLLLSTLCKETVSYTHLTLPTIA